MPATQIADILARIAPFDGALTALVNLCLVFLLLRANGIFRDELTAVDRLMSEYVRFRDLLLSARKPEGGVSGLRLLGDEAFREAWRNFNQQLDTIRSRYRLRALRLRVWLILAAGLFAIGALIWGFYAGEARGDWRQIVFVAGAWLSSVGLGVALLQLLRQNGRLMQERTSGSYLLAPWPSDGGTVDRQFALLGKFLPVEVGAPPEETSPEVSPSA